MFDASAIKELSQSEAIKSANLAITDVNEDIHVVGLTNDFSLHDLEKYLPVRRRARGAMFTTVTGHFAKYVETHAEDGACVFVSPEKMQAVAVLNLGSTGNPGHADNTACLELKKTAAFIDLLKITSQNQPLNQRQVAEFMEDWRDYITCYADAETTMETKRAIAAVRTITIEALSRMENTEETFGATKSTLDSVKASSKEKLPGFIDFSCAPRNGLRPRTFRIRVGVLTGGTTPSLTLRIIKLEEHEEQMAEELAEIVTAEIPTSVPVLVGTYVVK